MTVGASKSEQLTAKTMDCTDYAWADNICVIAAEASGDANAAALIESLRKLSPRSLKIWGVAGPKMRAAGVEAIARVEELSVMGFAEVIAQYLRLRLIHRRVEAEILRRRPELVILVDAPSFNLRIAELAFQSGSIVHYHIPPKVWAHGEGRCEILASSCHLVTCVLPFEEDFLRSRGVHAHYVGHPLKDQVDYFRKEHGSFVSGTTVRSTAMNIGLLPGSRRSEVRHHLKTLVHAFAKVQQSLESHSRSELGSGSDANSNSSFNSSNVAATGAETNPRLPLLIGLIPIAETLDENWFRRQLSRAMVGTSIPEGTLRAVRGSMYSVLSRVQYAWVCSGTAVLETCFFEVPHSVVYRTSRLSYEIASRLVKVQFIGLVNLIAGRALTPEFIQDDFSVENLARHAQQVLTHPEELQHAREQLHEISESFPSKSGDRAARLLLSLMDYWQGLPREARQRMYRRGLGPKL
jgi:lipid-A-disaccharide synthase